MKVRLEQLNPVVGAVDANAERILEALDRAGREGIELLVLPEMILTGYPVQDLLENRTFCEACFAANERIASRTGETALLFGTITPNRKESGKAICNAALLCRNGKQVGRAVKSLLPVYDIFDEQRYFEPGEEHACLELDGIRLGVTICEDIWHNENETGRKIYSTDPAGKLRDAGAQVLVNISASPYTRTKHERRLEVLADRARTLGMPLFYCNQAGAQTDVIFDGDTLVMDRNGNLKAIAEPFLPGRIDLYWNPSDGGVEPSETCRYTAPDPDRRLFDAMLTGIRDYLGKTGVSDRLLLGLSGGIDSALVAVLAVEAVGPEKVMALTMPSQYSTSGSVRDSEILAGRLGIELRNVPIAELFDRSRELLAPVFGREGFGIAEENLQSRLRGLLLMACSNRMGQLLLTTGNKSELAVGYATLYGDMNGGLNPVGDLYKSDVFRLCRWLNSVHYGREVIPAGILEKPPSAELRPGQKDSDSLPPYEILDDILFRYIERGEEADRIASDGGHDLQIVKKVLGLTDGSEFKRFQAPPILKLTSKSFGSGRRWPIVQGWTRNRGE